MGLELILVIISFLAGVMVLFFASRIGTWIFNMNLDIKKGLAETPMGKFLYDKRQFSWVTIGLSIGPPFYIWLIRIIGIAFAGGSVFILYMVLFA